jgi:hypothetical protein
MATVAGGPGAADGVAELVAVVPELGPGSGEALGGVTVEPGVPVGGLEAQPTTRAATVARRAHRPAADVPARSVAARDAGARDAIAVIAAIVPSPGGDHEGDVSPGHRLRPAHTRVVG